jgi:hypothetical protein
MITARQTDILVFDVSADKFRVYTNCYSMRQAKSRLKFLKDKYPDRIFKVN